MTRELNGNSTCNRPKETHRCRNCSPREPFISRFVGPSRNDEEITRVASLRARTHAHMTTYVCVCMRARYTRTVTSSPDYLDVPGPQWSAFQKSRTLSNRSGRRQAPLPLFSLSLSFSRQATCLSFSTSRLIARLSSFPSE